MVIKLGNVETKKEIMRNKSKLKEEIIFIENDLNWEERKIQKKIYNWVRAQREKGIDLKIGLGKIRVKRVWRTEIEKKKEEKKVGEGTGKERQEENRRDRREEGEGTVRGRVETGDKERRKISNKPRRDRRRGEVK